MNEHERAPVTVIGLGPMGSSLARTFLAEGHPTTVWNRTAGKADALVALGARRAATVDEAVRASSLVVVCVIDYDAVHAILDPVAGTLAGRVLVNLTADTPERSRTTAEWAAGHGIAYLDGSIMTPAATIGTSDAVFLYSGPESLYQGNRAALAGLGGTAVHLGADPGRAAAYDLALLDFFWTAVAGYTHSLALARAEGISGRELAPYAKGIFTLLPGMIDEYAGQADDEKYPGTDSPLVSNLATVDHIIHAAEARGVDAGMMRALKAAGDRAIADGHGADGFVRLAEVFGNRAAPN
jgi:3-hydroxyisobutyrate dehydrogenase-like beta-hydroxyacid dehydrogenase